MREILGEATLGDVARGTGLSKSHVSKIFSGNRKPGLEAVARLAAYLGITIDDVYAAMNKSNERTNDDDGITGGVNQPAHRDSEEDQI
jgi:transcriptional regulator with XRE-family HTH domain